MTLQKETTPQKETADKKIAEKKAPQKRAPRKIAAKPLDPAVEALLAKQAISEVLYRYCRAFDRMDYDLALTVWHPGGTCNYTNRIGTPDIPVFQYFGSSWAHRAKLRNHSHQVTNILIELADDHAVSEAFFTASLQTQPENGQILEHLYRGRYLDRWSRRSGLWAIDHRQVVFDSYTPYEFAFDRISAAPMDLSRRDRDDPSYALFASLRKTP